MTYLRKERRRAAKRIGQVVEEETGRLPHSELHLKLVLVSLRSKRWCLKWRENLARKCWRRKVEGDEVGRQILIFSNI